MKPINITRRRLWFIATPSALRRALQRSPEVRLIRESLKIGALDEEAIGHFVESLMTDLKPGMPFAHDLTLSALAVALDQRGTGFAEKFLEELAGLQAAEMSMSIRVARECLRAKSWFPAGSDK